MDFRPYLDDLLERMDPAREREILEAWRNFADCKNGEGPFSPPRRDKRPPKIEWPFVHINDTLDDEEKMLYWQLQQVSAALAGGSRELISIRANFGVGTLASMLGAEPYVMPREMQNLPNVRAIGGDKARRLAGSRVDWHRTGVGPGLERMAELLAKTLDYDPTLRSFVFIDHPDLQGPMDNAELLWGSDIFYTMVDEPETIHALLGFLTDLMTEILDWWLPLFPGPLPGYLANGCHLVRGGVFIRDDSGMNLSPTMCREYILPYDGRLLARYGGGVHFCGRGDHYIAELCRLPGLKGVNMTQPVLNDMDRILRHTADSGIPLSIALYGKDVALGMPSLAGHDARRVFLKE